jgi:hypothetical protein
MDALKKQTYCLINGSFDPDDARQLLLNLINDKINFHQRNDLSRKERFGEADTASLKRIEELRRTKTDIMELMEYANSIGMKLTRNCDIDVLLEKQVQTPG